MRENDELWTVVTEALVTEIRATAARHGGMENLAFATGIPDRTYRNIFCQRIVSLTVIDRFCTHADTGLWVTDLDWKPWMEMMDEIDPTYRERIRLGGEAYARSLHEQSDAGTESVSEQAHSGQGDSEDGSLRTWTAGDGPRSADSD